jgi:hypothetical protein
MTRRKQRPRVNAMHEGVMNTTHNGLKERPEVKKATKKTEMSKKLP